MVRKHWVLSRILGWDECPRGWSVATSFICDDTALRHKEIRNSHLYFTLVMP